MNERTDNLKLPMQQCESAGQKHLKNKSDKSYPNPNPAPGGEEKAFEVNSVRVIAMAREREGWLWLERGRAGYIII